MSDAIEETRRAVEGTLRDFADAAMKFDATDPVNRASSLKVSREVQAAFLKAVAAVDAHALAVLEEAEAFCRDGRGDLLDALRDRLAGK